MKIEHLTLLGNSVIRDSNDILLSTLEILKDFQIDNTVKTLPFPRTNFTIKITTTPVGAMFDIMKFDQIAFLNVCCFEKKHKHELLNTLKSISKKHPFIKADKVQNPQLDQFLYTIIINPLICTIEEIKIAGEIEFYIYYALLLGHNKHLN